jgi:hypothetical protein
VIARVNGLPTTDSRWLAQLLTVVCVTLFTASCAGKLFKVKPAVDLPPLVGDVKNASAGGITIRVAPLLSDEESQEIFEANLPLCGVLPLRVELAYESGVPVELIRASFRLRDGEVSGWKLLTPKQAISRIMKANDISAYNPNSRKQFAADFKTYALDVTTPLSSSDRRRQGFLYFQTPNKEPVESPRGLVLEIERVPQAVEIALN